jgi:hypothetical protein
LHCVFELGDSWRNEQNVSNDRALRQSCSVRQMQSHLNDATLVSGLKTSHPAKQRISEQGIGIGPVAVVQNIQSFRPELQVDAFMKAEVFQQGRIDLRRAWPGSKRSWRVAESVSRVLLEGGGVEPFRSRPLTGAKNRIAHQIWTHAVGE